MDILQEKRNLLKEKVQKIMPSSGLSATKIKGFSIALRTAPTTKQHCFYKPMVILVLQGKKQAILGSESFIYDENQLVVTSIDIPAVGSIIEATPKKPFMTLILELDAALISELLREGNYPANESSHLAMGIVQADEALLDAFYRLISLLDYPDRQKIMAPMIIKEIHYLLLTSSLGGILRLVNTKGSQNNQIANAIEWLKENYRQPLKVEELAQKFNMAESSFYRHFSRVTSLSPLQYQKRLRLYEAQRLMLAENVDAANAAYKVGYESASQFNREYKRMFGLPPKTNVNQIKRA